MNDLDWARLRRRAHDVAGLAATYGWDIPPEYGSASAVAYQARQIANEPPPRPTPPTDQHKVTAWVTKAAEARMRHREQTAVAADLDTDAERQAMRAILDETLLASYVANLCDVFAAPRQQLRPAGQHEAAPLEITGQTPEHGLRLHHELVRATEGLTRSALHRGQIAIPVGDYEGIDRNLLWLVLDLPDSASLFGVAALLDEFIGRMPPPSASGAGLPGTASAWPGSVRPPTAPKHSTAPGGPPVSRHTAGWLTRPSAKLSNWHSGSKAHSRHASSRRGCDHSSRPGRPGLCGATGRGGGPTYDRRRGARVAARHEAPARRRVGTYDHTARQGRTSPRARL